MAAACRMCSSSFRRQRHASAGLGEVGVEPRVPAPASCSRVFREALLQEAWGWPHASRPAGWLRSVSSGDAGRTGQTITAVGDQEAMPCAEWKAVRCIAEGRALHHHAEALNRVVASCGAGAEMRASMRRSSIKAMHGAGRAAVHRGPGSGRVCWQQDQQVELGVSAPQAALQVHIAGGRVDVQLRATGLRRAASTRDRRRRCARGGPAAPAVRWVLRCMSAPSSSPAPGRCCRPPWGIRTRTARARRDADPALGPPGSRGRAHSAGVCWARAGSGRQQAGVQHSLLPLTKRYFVIRLVTIADSKATDAGPVRRRVMESPRSACVPCRPPPLPAEPVPRCRCGGADERRGRAWLPPPRTNSCCQRCAELRALQQRAGRIGLLDRRRGRPPRWPLPGTHRYAVAALTRTAAVTC
ncbi:hypothetical protein FQR65_LT20330 [Abscondita terminalis]|nr:hypothetical protein FQR65_LT20330 [Abscondita terminalis]